LVVYGTLFRTPSLYNLNVDISLNNTVFSSDYGVINVSPYQLHMSNY